MYNSRIRNIVQKTIEAVEKRAEPSLIQKSLHVIKDLAIGTGGSLIASGIIGLISSIPMILQEECSDRGKRISILQRGK